MKRSGVVLLLLLSQSGRAQRNASCDTSFIATSPVSYHVSPVFSSRHIGVQAGIDQLLKQTEIHKNTSSSKEKIIKKQHWLGVDLGFYTQKYLHNSLFLTGNYTFRRVGGRGFYRQFRPFLGISQTFLNEESYSVTDDNEVVLHQVNGSFYFTGGVGISWGKVFSPQQSKFLRDVHAGTMLQSYFPNFRFIALQPSLQIGISAEIPGLTRRFRQKIIVKP